MSGAVPLRILSEADVLTRVEAGAIHEPAPPRTGVRTEVEAPHPVDAGAALRLMEANSRGPVRPARVDHWLKHPVDVCRVGEVLYAPRFGLLAWEDGRALHATFGGPLTDPDKLGQAPLLARREGGFNFTPSVEPPPVITAASVFMPWGGGFNYGHFLTDALPSLLALEEAGLLETLPPVAPPMKRWQREGVGLLLGGRAPPVRELPAPVVRLGQAAYATSMDHYLHAPGPLLLRVRERLLAATPSPRAGARRLYLSRRSHSYPMRVCLNEAELERALAARGFLIVRPERLTPSEQIALARGAEVIVGPSGAAMANALFAEPGACVIEIQPQVFTSAWLPAFANLVGLRWRIYYAPAPVPAKEAPWVRRSRRGFRFAWRAPLDDVLATVDAEIG